MTTDRERKELKARLRKADVITPIDLLAAADTIAELEREIDRWDAVCKEMGTRILELERENEALRKDRDEWKDRAERWQRLI